jgi:general secretion pathway protein B
MSYILDALKKADAQRERDPARGIHAHPAPVGPARVRDAGSPWVWAGAAVVVAIVGGGAWMLLQDRAAVDPAPVVASATAPAVIAPPAAVAPPPAPAVAAAPVPAASAPANEPVAAVVLPPPEPPRPVARVEPEEEAAGSIRHRPRARVPVRPTATASSGATTAAASGAAPGAPSAAAPAHTPAATTRAAAEPLATGLPADAPKLAVTGGVYSANRAQRMLIVNGQVVNEGADLGGGVVLEEIKPKSAVLRFRGGRYSVAF